MDNQEVIRQAKELLDKLDDYKIGLELLQQDKRKLLDEVIPPEIKQAMADIEAEFAGKAEPLQVEIEKLEIIIKQAALQVGETIKGENMMAVYSKPRVSWDTKGLEGYMMAHPEIVTFRKTSETGSVSLRRR
jgi:hypothetical protein